MIWLKYKGHEKKADCQDEIRQDTNKGKIKRSYVLLLYFQISF